MINYVVKPGDMIGVLAVKYKTTIRIIMKDNPIIPENQLLQEGWIIKIHTPEENAKRYTDTAYDRIEAAHRLKEKLETSDHLLNGEREPVYYKDRLVLEGQIGFLKTLKATPLIEVQANGYQKTIRTLPAGEILRVYEHALLGKTWAYLVDAYRWVSADPKVTLYEEIPLYDLDGKYRLPKPAPKMMRAASVSAAAAKPNSFIGYGPKISYDRFKVAPTSMIGSGPKQSGKGHDGISSIPLFENPNFKRPVMHLKNAKGESTKIELRVLGFNASYSNNVQPSPTNAGWMVNVRAHNLPVLSISGFLMETKANDEFKGFMSRYHQYLAAKKTDDFYSLALSTLYYKQTEYRGIVTSFSYSDRQEESLHRKYSMQMIILKEKLLSGAEIKKIPAVVSRKGLSEKAFRSDVGAMLANPITGKYFVDLH